MGGKCIAGLHALRSCRWVEQSNLQLFGDPSWGEPKGALLAGNKAYCLTAGRQGMKEPLDKILLARTVTIITLC